MKTTSLADRVHRQHGLVLILALIVLAALSIAAVGLMRGVSGSNRVAGNLAFQQAAVQAADAGVGRAVEWLEQKAWQRNDVDQFVYVGLDQDLRQAANERFNYSATRGDPGPNQSWENFWTTLAAAGLVNTLPRDANGNEVQFVIHRLCQTPGDAVAANCEQRFEPDPDPRCARRSPPLLCVISLTYYRITVRVTGPRNARSFIQAVVAI